MGETTLGADSLAAAVGVSRTLLYTKLKALTGQSVMVFINTLRVKRGAQLLQSSGLTVAEIAYRVGFKHRSHFSRYFRDVFGVPPSEYRPEAPAERS